MTTSSWYVKLARGGWETVLDICTTQEEALSSAAILNERYQTDEYYVEPWDETKAFTWTLPRKP